jgi:hypothetical protein
MNLLKWMQSKEEPALEPTLEELRAAPRFSLVMRTAKLLCESGEYVCIVRDISATGAKLRLFHQVPPDTHLYLELANGQRYAMERMWQEGEHAGFRFASPIVVAEFVEETSDHPRRPMRLGLQRSALLTGGGRDWRAMMVNLSQQGAGIEASGEIPVGQLVRFEVPGLPLRFGHVCWRRKFAHGLAFQNAFRLDELARYAFELQPFAAVPEIAPVEEVEEIAGDEKRYA